MRHLLELAHSVARSDARRSGGAAVPDGLERVVQLERLPRAWLGAVRSALDVDADFRERVALLADKSEVGEVAWLWITRPDHWADRIRESYADETATGAQLDEMKLEIQAAKSQLASVTAKLASVEEALKQERRSVAEFAQMVEVAEAESETKRARGVELEQRATRAEQLLGDERLAHKRTTAALADATSTSEDSIVDAPGPATPDAPPDQPATAQPKRRRPHRSARGVLDDSPAGVDELIRVPRMQMLVDGYNVTKTGWPNADLYTQRERLLSAMAARLGGRLIATVVFDGADVTGAGHNRHQSQVRVTWSPAGV
ncbi:MAG: hypothetical protein GXP35_00780, partial [Actinobacteria bacterium]|nr:hypothetical protein [Actinomycetota bacterium]